MSCYLQQQQVSSVAILAFIFHFFLPFFIQARVEIKSGVPFPVLSFTLVCVVAIVVFALPRFTLFVYG